MPILKARFSGAVLAAALVLLALAAPAAAGGPLDVPNPPGAGLGRGGSLPPQSPLDQPPGNPIAALFPGDPRDELSRLIGGPSSDPAPQPTSSSPTTSAPKAEPARSSVPQQPTRRPTSSSPSSTTNRAEPGRGSRADGLRNNAAAPARGSQTRSAGSKLGALDRSKPRSPAADKRAAVRRPRSLVGKVINRIPPQYRAALIALACLSTFFALVSLREWRRSMRAERQALVDPLTGLPNRQAFDLQLAKEWNRSQRYNRDLGLVLLDLDDFKQINDTKGHAAGDAVLREVAAAVSSRIRVSDMAARLGGDEFVVLCPETPAAGLEALARSLDKRLQQASIRTSVGFSEREPTDSGPPDLVARADAAMYRRKQGARAARLAAHSLPATGPLAGAAAD